MSAPQFRRVTALSPSALAKLERLIRLRGEKRTAEILGVHVSTVDRALGPGVMRATVAKLEAKIAEVA